MIKALFWEIAARLGFWIPCDKYLPNGRNGWDWVLISYYEPGLTYRHIPRVAEISPATGRWHDLDDSFPEDEFLNEMCEITHWRKIPNDRYLKIK